MLKLLTLIESRHTSKMNNRMMNAWVLVDFVLSSRFAAIIFRFSVSVNLSAINSSDFFPPRSDFVFVVFSVAIELSTQISEYLFLKTFCYFIFVLIRFKLRSHCVFQAILCTKFCCLMRHEKKITKKNMLWLTKSMLIRRVKFMGFFAAV